MVITSLPTASRQQGFTLVEMIVVIVISSILSGVIMQFIITPIESYQAVSRRARLVDIAETAFQRLAPDVRAALPNSFRVGCAGHCLEFLRAVTGGRYRAGPPGDSLSFNPADADTSFSVLGPLNYTSEITSGSGASDCVNNTASCLAIYNTGQSGSNAWNADNVATVTAIGSSPLSVTFNNTAFASGVSAFPADSPYQRFYITDTPVKYICDTGSSELRRYQGYSIEADETSVDSHAELLALANPAEHALLADQISNCLFTYVAGTATRNGVVTISLTVQEKSERVTLLQQLHVVNLP